MPFPTEVLPARYDPVVVALSILVAVLASYTALDLARRLHGQDRSAAAVWTLGGAFVMGSGIWSMHFIGMLAMSLPIRIGFVPWTTFLSWLAAVGVSLLALALAGRERLGWRTLVAGALAMGGGICAMHYIGMAAIDVAPGIRWSLPWVAASALVACVAAAVALLIFFGMRRLTGLKAKAAQGLAALVMGLAISGMHYTGMAAASFPADSVCLSVSGLGAHNLVLVILVAVLVLLSIALFTTALDARLQARAAGLAQSLSAANAELQRLAFRDPLTGVPNRMLFEERLQQAVARAERGGADRLALLFIDLDGFKPVNDGYGHAVGDAVLRQVAERLRSQARGCETLARLGGDEFVLLIEGIGEVADAVAAAERVLQAMAAPFAMAGREITLSASVGVVVHPGHTASVHLLASADAAMYAAKRAGGASYAVFAPHMDEHAAMQLELVQDLRHAIGTDQLHLLYQPKVDARSGQVRGVEALLRWRHPGRGPIGPGVFVPLAERFGLIVPLGAWVIDEACRQMAEWGARGRRLRVSVNLSAYQLRQADIAQRIGEAIARHRLAPDQLVCEITESAAMEDTDTTRHVLRVLAALGVKVSIDDFGTGYSSLAKLRGMRAHELKIDREFVADVAHDADARAVVDAIVHLGRALDLRIVAEGVETAAQRDVLCALGCDELQGFLYARPLPPQALLAERLPGPAAERPLGFSPSVLMADEAPIGAVA